MSISKPRLLTKIIPLLVLTISSNSAFSGTFSPVKVKPKPAINKNVTLKNPRLGNIAAQLRCPDLTIQSMRIKSIQHYNGQYILELSAQVKNVGNADYRSSANQQQVAYSAPGLNGSSIPFGNVGKGQSVPSGAIFRNIAGGEFTPNITAKLIYDPDIRMDKNSNNDDCNGKNNKTVLSRNVILAAIANYRRTHH